MVQILNSAELPGVNFEPFWFNCQEYLKKQDPEGIYTLISRVTGDDEAFMRLFLVGDKLISPLRAPFGAPEFSGLRSLEELIHEMPAFAGSKGVKSLKLVAWPQCYDEIRAAQLHKVLLKAGFGITVTELNYHLDIGPDAFDDLVHESEKRRLAKSFRAGFTFSREENADYRTIHSLIADCRARKGHPLSMNADDFEKMFRDFKDRYHLFTVKDHDRVIAASVGVKVRSDILYCFLPADHEAYLTYSPSVLLNKGMYEFCQQNGIRLYDLGIGTAGGIRNEGLIRFKEHIGGKMSFKYTYEIKI